MEQVSGGLVLAYEGHQLQPHQGIEEHICLPSVETAVIQQWFNTCLAGRSTTTSRCNAEVYQTSSHSFDYMQRRWIFLTGQEQDTYFSNESDSRPASSSVMRSLSISNTSRATCVIHHPYPTVYLAHSSHGCRVLHPLVFSSGTRSPVSLASNILARLGR